MSVRDIFSSFALIVNTDWIDNTGGPFSDGSTGSYLIGEGSTLTIAGSISAFEDAGTWGMLPTRVSFSDTIDFSGTVIDDFFDAVTGVTPLGNSISDENGVPMVAAGISGTDAETGYFVCQIVNPANSPENVPLMKYARFYYDVTGTQAAVSSMGMRGPERLIEPGVVATGYETSD